MAGVRGRLLGVLAATVVALGSVYPAAASDREGGAVGTFLEDWFGLGQSSRGDQPFAYYINPQSITTTRTGSPGVDLTNLGRSQQGIKLNLADSDEADSLFTPRVQGFKLGLSIDPADRDRRTPGSAAIDLSQKVSEDVRVGATLSFVDGQPGGLGGGGNTMGTALRIGFGGFVVGGGVRFSNEPGKGSTGWGVGASYALGDISLSAGYVDSGDGSRVGDQTGLSIGGRYQIRPGLAAQAAGFFGQGERNDMLDRDSAVAVRGGIALDF